MPYCIVSLHSLLTRIYELKEPVRKSLMLNALDFPFREPITFILYVLVLKYRFAELTHTVFDSHLDISLVQAYEIPLLGIPLSSFPSFVCCCFVVTSQLYHFRTESQDFFELFLYFFSHNFSANPKLFKTKISSQHNQTKNVINLNKTHARAIVGKYKN